MKDLVEKLIDAANAKINLRRDAEQRKADDLARAKAEGQKLADAYCETHQPMFAAAVAALYHHSGIHISEIVCGQVPVTRALTYSDLEDAFLAWMTMAMEARCSRPDRPRF